MRIRVFIVALAISVTLSVYPQTSATAGVGDKSTATVYFYRPEKAAGAKASPTVICDQVRIATIRNGQFVTVSLPPGKHVIEAASFAGSRQTVVLDPGDTYYFRADMELFSWKMTTIHGKLTLVLPQQGKSDIAQLQPVQAEHPLE